MPSLRANKILVITGLYVPEIGGPATHTALLERELPRRGIEVSVLPFREVRHLPKVVRHMAFFFKTIRRAQGVDIVFSQDPMSVGLPGILACMLIRKPFVVRIAGDYAWEQSVQRCGVSEPLDTFAVSKKGYPLIVMLWKKLQTFVARKSDKIVVPSKYMQRIVSAWGVDIEKISVVYSAYEPVEIKSELPSAFPQGVPVIISAARLVPWKGMDVLIECLPNVRNRVSNAVLVIAGDGPERENLEARVRELGLKDAVVFLGSLPRPTLFRCLEDSHVFVLNTGYEGLSHLLLEALDAGIPVISTNVGGNPELIEHEKSGVLVPYNNGPVLSEAVVRILDDSLLGARLVEEGKKKLLDFSHERAADQIVAVLNRVPS